VFIFKLEFAGCVVDLAVGFVSDFVLVAVAERSVAVVRVELVLTLVIPLTGVDSIGFALAFVITFVLGAEISVTIIGFCNSTSFTLVSLLTSVFF